jgi:acyl carrier protein
MEKQDNREIKKEIRPILRRYIFASFLPQSGLDTFSESDSFMEKGLIDSTGILELLEFIEGEFGIKVEDEEVIPDNLDSLERLAKYIHRKLAHAGQ